MNPFYMYTWNGGGLNDIQAIYSLSNLYSLINFLLSSQLFIRIMVEKDSNMTF